MINKQYILDRVGQQDIMERYFPETIVLGKRYVNPFRSDRTAACYFVWSNGGYFIFVDHAAPHFAGNCFDICMLKYGITFSEALQKIAHDFGISSKDAYYDKLEKPKKRLVPKKKTIRRSNLLFQLTSRSWDTRDKLYWNGRYGFTGEILKFFNVVPLKRVKKKRKHQTTFFKVYEDYGTTDPCYAFKVPNVDGGYQVKLYRPLAKSGKWDTNCNNKNVQGLDQIPESGELLVITSSLKDAMALYTIGVPAIASTSETTFIPEKLLEDLKARFVRIVILFDRDETGSRYAKKFADLYEVEYKELIEPPEDLNFVKDPADYLEYLGDEEFKDFIELSLN